MIGSGSEAIFVSAGGGFKKLFFKQVFPTLFFNIFMVFITCCGPHILTSLHVGFFRHGLSNGSGPRAHGGFK